MEPTEMTFFNTSNGTALFQKYSSLYNAEMLARASGGNIGYYFIVDEEVEDEKEGK